MTDVVGGEENLIVHKEIELLPKNCSIVTRKYADVGMRWGFFSLSLVHFDTAYVRENDAQFRNAREGGS